MLKIDGPVNENEAAAIAAAIEQFVAETSPVAAGETKLNPWQREAFFEATDKNGYLNPWGDGSPWG